MFVAGSEVGGFEDLLDIFDGLSLRELRRHVVLRLWSGFDDEEWFELIELGWI
jgi:hypothetical protein